MKKQLYSILAVMLLITACQSEPSRNTDESAPPATENTDAPKKLVIPWSVQVNDSTQMMEIRRDPAADMSRLIPGDIVNALNIKYPDIKLVWLKQEGSTAFVKIDDATFLTQQSGSEGARAYLAEATFSFTEFDNIKSVDFSFTEGDHAQPGIYSREDFEGFN